MQAVLSKVNTIPGVVGSMLCDAQGRLLAHAFPATFDDQVLGEAAAALADGSVGLESVTGTMALIDLRYEGARILARPVAGALLLLLCTPAVNVQLATMSVSVASRRSEQLVSAREAGPSPRSPAVGARAAAAPVAEDHPAAPTARRPEPPTPKKTDTPAP